MPDDKFAIVNLRDGQRRDVESFLLDNDAFPVLENAYLFRGRIQRRSCTRPVGIDGRLKGTVGTTDAGGNLTLLDGTSGLIIPDGVASFVINGDTLTDSGSSTTLLTTGATTGTITRNTGLLSTNAPNADVTYLPGLPVMGLCTYEQVSVGSAQPTINDELLFAFDTRYTYLFDRAANDFEMERTFVGTTNVFVWTGNDSDFFWSTNYANAFWATNNNPGLHIGAITGITNANPGEVTVVNHGLVNGDTVFISQVIGMTEVNGQTYTVTVTGVNTFTIGVDTTTFGVYGAGGTAQFITKSSVTDGDGIRWYGTVSGNTGWSNFSPPINTAQSSFLLGGLCIVPYQGRLLVFNTVEGSNLASAVRYPQRVRWCQIGTPFYANSPTNFQSQSNSWNSDPAGKGGFLDAPTGEAIVSVEFIKNTLIVYFERSTWQLVYVGNPSFPFAFQKINTEFGCESTFSLVPFDRGIFAIGNYGITTCDSVNVSRIDQKIPDEVFRIQNINNGVKRVHGIRDYNAQLVYWTYPVISDYDGDVTTYHLTYPNQLLVFNYLDGSWAQFDDHFTCFGYFQKFNDLTWEDAKFSWESAQFAWNSQVIQAKYPDVIAGNQRGFVSVFSQLQQIGQNMKSLPIANISGGLFTVTNHNLVMGDFVLVTDCVGSTGINDGIYKVESPTVNTFILTDSSGNSVSGGGTYAGEGLITFLPNIYIETKQFNPYMQDGKSLRFTYLDIFCDRTEEGEFTAQFYVSDNSSEDTGNYIVPTYPETQFSQQQAKIFHRIHTDEFGSFIQAIFTLSDDQMFDLSITTSDITIHGIVFYLSACGRLTYEF